MCADGLGRHLNFLLPSCYFTAHKIRGGGGCKPKNPLSPVCYLSLTSASDECWRFAGGGQWGWQPIKREVILVLIIKKGCESPKVLRSTRVAAAHGGGYRHGISQTAGQIQPPRPAAPPPQVAQPPISDGPVIRFGMGAIRGASWSPHAGHTLLRQVQPHRTGCIQYLTAATSWSC